MDQDETSTDASETSAEARSIAAEPVLRADPDFGRKMIALRASRGSWGGRRPIAVKYGKEVSEAEALLAASLVQTVKDYLAELKPKEPEQCPTHKRIIGCPQCEYTSQRTVYNHGAAAYHMDRIFGRPTSRSENTITIKLYQQLAILFVEAFQTVNEISDPTERQIAYAECIEAIEAQYGTSGQ